MRFATLVIFLLPLSIFAQTEQDVLAKSNQLVAQKQYVTAFQTLEKFDPRDTKPDIVLAKEDIALNYFVTSIMHQMFGLKNLKPNENVYQYRGQAGTSDMFVFKIDSVLNQLITKYPDNYKLYNGLGMYYEEVHEKYPNWLIPADSVLKLFKQNYEKVIDHQAGTYKTYYGAGLANLYLKNNAAAIPLFIKSTEINGTALNANSFYNLAYAYINNDQLKEALPYAKKSIELYNDKSFRGDAARMAGDICHDLDDQANALHYYELANQIDPGNYYTLKKLLPLYLKTGNSKSSAVLAQFYKLDPENPQTYNDLKEIYGRTPQGLITFYNTRLPLYKKNAKAEGSLYFYLTQAYLLTGDKKSAGNCVRNARIELSKVFDKSHPVFSAIDTLAKQAN